MKVLHLGPLWFPVSRDAAGGRETFLAGLIAALDKLGCRNTLLAARRFPNSGGTDPGHSAQLVCDDEGRSRTGGRLLPRTPTPAGVGARGGLRSHSFASQSRRVFAARPRAAHTTHAGLQ